MDNKELTKISRALADSVRQRNKQLTTISRALADPASVRLNEQLTKISRALADPARLRIYEAIAGLGEVICGELVTMTGLAPGTVSHHLKVLAEAHLIVSRRDGQFISQLLIPETMKGYTEVLARFSRRRRKQPT